MQKSITNIVTDGERVLLLKRGSTAPWMPNKYCFPGGKIEDGENIVIAGLRELKEETGISYPESVVEYIDVKFRSNYSKRVLLLKYKDLPKVKLNWEHSDYEWVSIKNIFDRNDLVPSIKPVIREFIKEQNNGK
jgi:dATP pyrophosphohydrolase